MMAPEADLLQEQITDLRRFIKKEITEKELRTFSVRPAISHGDIEIFLNGRFWPINSAHFAKVTAANSIEDFVMGILPRLRGKKYIFSTQNHQYTHENVLREINYVLVKLLDSLPDPEEIVRIQQLVDQTLVETFGYSELPRTSENYKAADFYVINLILTEELGRILKGPQKNVRTGFDNRDGKHR